MRRQRQSTRGLIVLIVAVLLFAAALSVLPWGFPRAPSQAPGKGPVSAPTEGIVTYVYDGDTVEVSGVGKVRILGIDAMDGYNMRRAASQSRDYGMPVHTIVHWAEVATQVARRVLDHKMVTLEYGPEATDRYGRVLAYVETGKEREDYGLMMIKKGLAAAYYIFQHPRRAQYLRAEDAAQKARVGMWADATKFP